MYKGGCPLTHVEPSLVDAHLVRESSLKMLYVMFSIKKNRSYLYFTFIYDGIVSLDLIFSHFLICVFLALLLPIANN